MWVCSKCGTRNDDNNTVCILCHEKRAPAGKPRKEAAPKKKRSNGRSWSNKILFLSATFLLLVSIVAIATVVRAAVSSRDERPTIEEKKELEGAANTKRSKTEVDTPDIVDPDDEANQADKSAENDSSAQLLTQQQKAELDDLVSRCVLFMLQTDRGVSDSPSAVFCLDLDGDGQNDWLMQDGIVMRALLDGKKGGVFLSKSPVDIRDSRRLGKPVLHVIVGSGTGYMDSYKVFNGLMLEELAYSDEQLLLDEVGSAEGADYMVEGAHTGQAEYTDYLKELDLENTSLPSVSNSTFIENTLNISPDKMEQAAAYLEQKSFITRLAPADLDGDGLDEQIFQASADLASPADIQIYEPEYGNYLGETVEWTDRLIILSPAKNWIISRLCTTSDLGTKSSAEAAQEQTATEHGTKYSVAAVQKQTTAELADGEYFIKVEKDTIRETEEGYLLEVDREEPVSFNINLVQSLKDGDILDLRTFNSAELGNELVISRIERISWYREDDYAINSEDGYPGKILTFNEERQQYILADPHSDYFYRYSAGKAFAYMTEDTIVKDDYTAVTMGTESEIIGGPEVLFLFFDLWGDKGETVRVTVRSGHITELVIPYSP